MLRSAISGRRRIISLLGSVSMMVVLAVAVIAPPMAVGQATRTWVSGVGDDANPCSRTAPCKTFAGAISKTASQGEINCLDPGGFGGLTIVKPITISCGYTEGGVLSAGAGVNGFVINLPLVTDVVTLRGLDFHGAGNAQNGIRIVSGGVVHIEDVAISGYRASNGNGMSIQPAGALELDIRNSSINSNGTGITGNGILIQPTGAGGSAVVTLTNVDISNNAQGLRVATAGNTGAGVKVTIVDSSVTGSQTAGFAAVSTPATAPIEMMVQNSTANYNFGAAFTANGSNARIRIGGCVVTGNVTGVQTQNSGIIESYGNNQINGNTTDGTPTPLNLT